MALSLAVRKGIRDAEKKSQEHLERIKEATGLDFVVEVDMAAAYEQAKKTSRGDSAESIGDCVYDAYLGELAYGISSFVEENPMHKEAIEELATARKIGFNIIPTEKEYLKINPNSSSYCRARLVNGVIVMEINGENFYANTSDIRSGLEQTFAGDGPISLKCRVDISKHAEKMEEVLENWEKACGAKFEVEVDYAGLLASIAKNRQENHRDSMGELVYTYVDAVLRDFIRKCEADEMNKEAVQEYASTRKIKMHIFKDEKEYKKAANFGGSYGRVRLVNGDMVIELNNDNFYANVDYIAEFDQTFSGV